MRLRVILVAVFFSLISTSIGAQAQNTTPLTGVAGKAVALPALMNGAYGGYTTAIYVENVSHTGAVAHASITYYDQSGTATGTGDATPVGGLAFWAGWTVRQDNGHSFATGGAGWGVLTSDVEVAVFVNEFAPGRGADGSGYSSIQMPAGGGTTLFAPAIANNAYGGYTTGIGLANTGSLSTTATVTYRDAAGTTITGQTVTLPPHAYAGLYSGDAALALPNGFAGTATITSSSQALAAVVNETGPGGQFSSYDAIASGTTTLFAPVALHGAYGGFNTGMGIQNTTALDTSITVTYFDSAGTAAGTVTKTLAANGYLGVYQGGADGPPASATGYTAAVTGGANLAIIVNEVNPTGTQSTSYNAETAGSGYLNMALVENAGSDGWSTGLGIMNVTSASVSFNLVYFDAQTGAFIKQIALTLGAHGYMGRYTPDDLPAGTRATAWLNSTTPGLAAICNEAGTGTLMSYNGQ